MPLAAIGAACWRCCCLLAVLPHHAVSDEAQHPSPTLPTRPLAEATAIMPRAGHGDDPEAQSEATAIAAQAAGFQDSRCQSPRRKLPGRNMKLSQRRMSAGEPRRRQ